MAGINDAEKFEVYTTYLYRDTRRPIEKVTDTFKIQKGIHIWHYQFLTSWPSLPHIMSSLFTVRDHFKYYVIMFLTFLGPPTHLTEVRFASFLSGVFITAIVVNSPENKLAKRTSLMIYIYICDHQYFLNFWIYPLFLIIQKIMTSYMCVPIRGAPS